MKNFYHKIAVACVCTSLSFAIGASKEAKAATFNSSFPYGFTFMAYDGGSFGSFDGLVDAVGPGSHTSPESDIRHSWGWVERTTASEIAALVEFSIPSLTGVSTGYHTDTGYRTDTRITNIISAILQVHVEWHMAYNEDPRPLGLFGYVRNGRIEGLDLEAGIFLGSFTGSRETSSDDYFVNFNVTPFLNRLVSNNNEFAGFALRSLTENTTFLGREGFSGSRFPPTLIVEGEYEVVPEPTTIFGSIIGLCLGGWLKRKKSSQQNKTKSSL